MKMYCERESLRLVGKVWEVRAKLGQICTQSISLEEWLHRRTRYLSRLPTCKGHPGHIRRA